ncbi:hypothetical protein GF348_11235 [candidate division KSB3 bacterium]|nr:hypothetical protein [candidate division KSB3 bacterium]
MRIEIIIIGLLVFSWCALRKEDFINTVIAWSIIGVYCGATLRFQVLTFNRVLILVYLAVLLLHFPGGKPAHAGDRKSGFIFLFFLGLYSAYLAALQTRSGLSVDNFFIAALNLGYFLTAFTIYTKRSCIRIRKVVWAFGPAAAVLSVVCIFQYFEIGLLQYTVERESVVFAAKSGQSVVRVYGLHGNPNAAALYLGTSLVAIFWIFLHGFESRANVINLLLLLLNGTALALTYSRASISAAVFCMVLVVIGYLKSGYQRRSNWFIYLFLAATVFFGIYFMMQRSYSDVGHGIGRLLIWQNALAVFAQNPFMGAATGTFNVHNGFLQVLMTQGILGFFLYSAALFTALMTKCRASQEVCIVKILVINFVLNNLTHSIAVASVLLWLLASLIFVQEDSTGRKTYVRQQSAA